MFDCSKELNTFYRNQVILPVDKKNELQEKRKLNVDRLKAGLKKYNEENNCNYIIKEDLIQGSVAMSTIVQNDNNNYDIDVGIVFDKDNLCLGPIATRNLIVKSLDMEMYQFSDPAEAKTSCVRVKYSKGYHIDFAIYRREKYYEWQNYKYDHAGAEWQERNLGIEDWFDAKRKEKDNLRTIVRFLKMFCNSRRHWNMPSGLIQTILCEENLCENEDRIDIVLYKTLESIINKLTINLEVNAPVDNNRPLTSRKKDEYRINNLKNRLTDHLKRLSILFNNDCSYEDAIEAWADFFNHTFWTDILKDRGSKRNENFEYTEQFIHDEYEVDIQYKLKIDCKVEGNGWSRQPITEYFSKTKTRKFIPRNFTVYCQLIYTDCVDYDKILWKVRNVGLTAEHKNMIRGQIKERGNNIKEPTSFKGTHYIECYLIKSGVCVARARIDIPIGGE